jgi:competence protein ComEC
VLPEANPVYLATGFLRTQAITTFERSLPPSYSALLLGVVFGIKRNLPDTLLTDLQTAGLMHVIAASGMNVSLVAEALYFLLTRILHRRFALVLSIIGIWFYALIAGMQSSIVRAAVMGSIALAAQYFGRQYAVLYVLSVTAMLMLLHDPSLLTDIGFQLSFLATAGIVCLKPKFAWLTQGQAGKLVGEDLTTTLSAQLATLPVLLTNFGIMNPFSVLMNLLVLWTIPPLMVIGSLAVLLSMLVPLLSELCIYTAVPLLWYFLTVASLGERLPLTIRLTAFPLGLSIGYYLLLSAWVLYQKKPGKEGKA